MPRSAKQRAALKKAQAASARKRRGKGKGKLAAANRRARRNGRLAVAVGAAAVTGVATSSYLRSKTFARHKAVVGEVRYENSYHGSLGLRGNISRARFINKEYSKLRRYK